MGGGEQVPNQTLADLMAEYGYTQEELAERVNDAAERILGVRGNATDRHVRRWLSGEVVWPQDRYRVPLERLFGREAGKLGFRRRTRRALSSVTVARAGTAADLGLEADPLQRRFFLEGVGGALLAVAASPRYYSVQLARTQLAQGNIQAAVGSATAVLPHLSAIRSVRTRSDLTIFRNQPGAAGRTELVREFGATFDSRVGRKGDVRESD